MLHNSNKSIAAEMPKIYIFRYMAEWGTDVLCMWVLLMVFTLSIGHELRFRYEALHLLADAVLAMSYVFLLPKRFRYLAFIPSALSAVYLVSSRMYYAYWGDLLSLSLIIEPTNWNGFVFKSAPDLFAWWDVAMILIVTLQVLVTWLIRRGVPDNVLPIRRRILLFVGSVLFYFAVLGVSMIQYKRYLHSLGVNSDGMSTIKGFFGKTTNTYGNWQKGLTMFFIMDVTSTLQHRKKHELTPEEVSFVRYYVINSAIRQAAESPLPTGMVEAFESNSSKNLIFIIVESLNAEIVGAKYQGMPVTPVLDSLLRVNGTVSTLNVQPCIEGGGSSDGQLIYNTGLLPIYSGSPGSTAQNYSSNTFFPSLAKSLKKRSSEEFIVEEGRIWFHTATSAAYGYDALNDADTLVAMGIDTKILGQDRGVFDMALRKMPGMKAPFFAEIVTLSMHFPYHDKGVKRQEWIDRLGGIMEIERNYLQMTNYFDTELGRFIRQLHEVGLYDNSVIVIASDHDQTYKDAHSVRDTKNAQPIVFIALNTGIEGCYRIGGNRRPMQYDVYPTILDIMGFNGTGYRGIGQSMLRAPVANAPGYKECLRASNLIITAKKGCIDF